MIDGYQTLNEDPDDRTEGYVGPFPDLDSSYDALWHGVWAGLESEWRPARTLALNCGIEYHVVDYHAKADWNLRDDLAHPKSFEHWASGEGFQGRAGLAWELPKRWSMHLDYTYRRWHADEGGLDRTYSANGTFSDTGLNEVNWESQSLLLGFKKVW